MRTYLKTFARARQVFSISERELASATRHLVTLRFMAYKADRALELNYSLTYSASHVPFGLLFFVWGVGKWEASYSAWGVTASDLAQVTCMIAQA